MKPPVAVFMGGLTVRLAAATQQQGKVSVAQQRWCLPLVAVTGTPLAQEGLYNRHHVGS